MAGQPLGHLRRSAWSGWPDRDRHRSHESQRQIGGGGRRADSGGGGEVAVKAESFEMDESLIYGSTTGSGAGSRISGRRSHHVAKRASQAQRVPGVAGALVVKSGVVAITGSGDEFDPKDIEEARPGNCGQRTVDKHRGEQQAGTIELAPNV